MAGTQEPPAPARRPEGARLDGLEDSARRADERLARLEAASAEMRADVEMLAEATGGLRQQSAKMREAALRVAEVVRVAAERKKRARKGARGARGQGEGRPPRTK